MSARDPEAELEWARREIYLLNRENDILRQRVRNLQARAHALAGAADASDCYLPPDLSVCLLCEREMPPSVPRRCPECDHVFAGRGWETLDAHWKANHLDVGPYEDLWSAMCERHRGE
jgi:hypothetical protein